MNCFYDLVFNQKKSREFDEESCDSKIALSTLTTSYTYGELKQEIKKYTEELSKYGDLKGSRVALIIPSVFTYISLFLAVNKLGGTAVPVSHQFRQQDLTSVLQLTKPHIVFTVNHDVNMPHLELVKNWADESKKQTAIYFHDPDNDWDLYVSEGEPYEKDEEKIDVIGCSSGSTGVPKGIMINMEAWENWISQIEGSFGVSENDAIFSTFPLNSPYGIAWALTSLKNKVKITFPENFDVFKIIHYLQNNQCNKIVATPSAYHSLNLFLQKGDKTVLKRLERIMISGEPITPAFISSLEGMDHCKLTGCYGISEQGILLVKEDMRELYETGWDVVEGIEVRIEEDQELVFKSPAALTGYYKRLDLTEEVFKKSWYYTGDLGSELENGNIKIIGRKKEMIKKGGQQVIPGEVEKVLSKHKNVKKVNVVGVPHPILGEKVVAFVVGDKLIAHVELFDLCKKEVAKFKVPDEIYQIEDLPMNQGKVDKLKLKKMVIEGTV